MVTVFCPSRTTGPGEIADQTAGEPRLVVDSKVNPLTLVGQVKTTLVPERMMASCGAPTAGSERLNTVPLPELPPRIAAPYKVLPDKIKPAHAPSLPLVKLCRFVKPVPSVLNRPQRPLGRQMRCRHCHRPGHDAGEFHFHRIRLFNSIHNGMVIFDSRLRLPIHMTHCP